MTEAVFWIIEVVATLMEGFLGITFIGSILGASKTEYVKSVGVSILYLLIIQWLNQYSIFSLFTTAVAMMLMGIAATAVYKVKIVDTMIGSAAYVALVYIVDFIMMSIWSILLGNQDFGLEVIQTYSSYRAVFVILCKTCLTGIYLLITKKIVPRISGSIRKMAVGVIACLFFVWYFGSLTFEEADMSLLITWITFLIVVLAGLYVLTEYSKWRNTKAEYELAMAKNEIIAASYEELSETYQSKRQLYHDMNNYYLVLRGYLEEGEYERAVEYLDSMHKDYKKSSDQWTGNQVLDMLLNYKKNIAQAKGIDVKINSDMILLPFAEKEVVALFGNALDNAIEACEKVMSGQRWIEVKMRRAQEMTFIEIANSYVPSEQTRKGILTSTKPDRAMHGLGIKGMTMIVEKHGGTIEFIPGDEVFTLKISIFH